MASLLNGCTAHEAFSSSNRPFLGITDTVNLHKSTVPA